MGLTDNFHSRYDLNMPVGVDFPSRLDPGFQSTSKSLECQRFKNLVSLTEKLVSLRPPADYASVEIYPR